MSAYLSHEVKQQLKNIAQNTIIEINNAEPPLNFENLYDHYRLNQKIIDIQKLSGTEFYKKLNLKILDKIRGVIFIPEKQIFVFETTKYIKRINFVLGHEFGHYKIPHHNAILYQCTQFDLSSKARKQLEIEANFFSSELNFLSGKFEDYLSSSNLTLQHIKNLSDLFNMSIEATLRKSVEIESRPCLFLSLNLNEPDEVNFLTLKYSISSNSFEKKYRIEKNQVFGRNHALAQLVTNPINKIINHCECEIKFGEKKIPMTAELWKNDWNIFAFIQPIKT